MSRTVSFGRDILSAPDVDIEELLQALAPSEVQSLVDEMAADPDDKHMPAYMRTAYKCEKQPTGKLDRDSLINHINEEGINMPEVKENVPYEAGKKRGKTFIPKLDEEQLEALRRQEAYADATRLDDEEEAALSSATTEDLMTLAEILGSNPQEFIMEAYSDPLKYYEPDPPNDVEITKVLQQAKDNNPMLKDVNLNNVDKIDEETLLELFESLRHNKHIVRVSVANCEVSDFAVANLCVAIEKNSTLKSLNLESNRIGPDSLASLFDAMATTTNGVVEVHVSNQSQSQMGFRVESRIANAIGKNNTLLKVGLRFEFTEVNDKVHNHLMRNLDRLRKERVKSEGVSTTKWKPATNLIDF